MRPPRSSSRLVRDAGRALGRGVAVAEGVPRSPRAGPTETPPVTGDASLAGGGLYVARGFALVLARVRRGVGEAVGLGVAGRVAVADGAGVPVDGQSPMALTRQGVGRGEGVGDGVGEAVAGDVVWAGAG